jgi:hypothetical protein
MMTMGNPGRIAVAASLVIGMTTLLVPEAWAFAQPFGIIRTSHRGVVGTGTAPVSPQVCPAFTRTSTPLWAAKKDQDDDNWEPNEADLASELVEDLEDDDLDSIEDTGMAVVADEDAAVEKGKKSASDDDDEDDDDAIDEGLDVWEEDPEEDVEITEEWEDGEEGDEDDDDEEWDEDEAYEDVPLEDDPDDPNYMAQKKLVEETVARRGQQTQDQSFDEIDFMMNQMTGEQMEAVENSPMNQEVEKMAREMITIDEDDVKNMDIEKELAKTPDLMNDDPYPNEGEENIMGTGISDNDLEQLDTAWKGIQETVNKEPWDKVMVKAENTDFSTMDNQTLAEMDACLDEVGGSAYNVTRWLLYDLDFNVSNLILAATKHNRQAPVLFQHWYPQLLTYERYQHARDRDFDFTWEDVENADIGELERYYQGFGYNEIPNKAPAETGIISFEDLDEEELKMAAFDEWMTEVYNPEWDRKDFDDDTFRDEDNVFSEYYIAPQHPDLPTFDDAQEDLREWEEDMGEDEDDKEYRDFMGKDHRYEVVQDEEFQKQFRGHMVIACTPQDEDLEIAETITARMAKEFGKQIYVETRVMAHAREEDFVFEVWLESYEIDLLHSKKRASSNAKDWDGPADCDAAQVDYVVEQVRFLISDEARYSYRIELDLVV